MYRSLHQALPPLAPPPVMMSSTSKNQPANHLPEHLHHRYHHLLLRHTHQSWVSLSDSQFLTPHIYYSYDVIIFAHIVVELSNIEHLIDVSLLLGETHFKHMTTGGGAAFRRLLFWKVTVIMNSTDDETAEQHNHTKKVMTEKGKSNSMDRGLNDGPPENDMFSRPDWSSSRWRSCFYFTFMFLLC